MMEMEEMETIRVLAVDDERSVLRAIESLLVTAGFTIRMISDGSQVLPAVLSFDPDVVLLDLNLEMPDLDGIDILQQIKASPSTAEVIIITGEGSTEWVVDTIRRGAFWFMDKPFDEETLLGLIRRAAERRFLSRKLHDQRSSRRLVGRSAAMQRLRETIRKVADDPVTVLITGESGTGKEIVAREIHELSRRRDRPFEAINCGAIPDNLIESELFGHVRGAFTDAKADKKGLFERARGGTVFLDEAVELPLSSQVSLLRVLQERELRRVGGERTIAVNVRVVASTNLDPEALVREGRFRQDLYYRLNVFPIHIPPLRERLEDIPTLAVHFLRQSLDQDERRAKRIERFSPEAMDLLQRHEWKGNARELANAIERAVVLSDGREIMPEALPEPIRRGQGAGFQSGQWRVAGPGLDSLGWAAFREQYLPEQYRLWLRAVLKKHQGNRARAARAAGMDRANLRKLLRKYGVDGDRA